MYSCKFRKEWLSKDEYKEWVQESADNDNKAYCKVCKKTIDLSNMGQRALTSHMKSKKHIESLSVRLGTSTQACITMFSRSSTSETTSSTSQSTSGTSKSTANTMTRYVDTLEVKKAEIIWGIKTVMSHISLNSNSDIGEMFRTMFPDSEIAKKFSCSATKMAYLITFGIAPYFTDQLIDKIRASKCYVASFDESLNEICQKGQMDINIRYFHQGKVVSQYLNSQFLGHSTATDLLQAFKKGTAQLDPSKLLQVSMDGPNVNLKFMQELLKDRKRYDPEMPGILQLGTCTLHTIHGAFATAMKNTEWGVAKLLRAIWYLFHDSPARRDDFQSITKSNVFGLQFCSTRWVEDVPVAERAIAIWPNIVKYVNETLKKTKKNIPTVASFITVRDFTRDPLVITKLQVFISTAKIVTNFLKKYQTDAPMLPFMAADLHNVLCNILCRFVKESVLTPFKATQMFETVVDVTDKTNWLSVDYADCGFAAKRSLEKLVASKKISPLARANFLSCCLQLYSTMAHKILERSPLKYSFVWNLQALDPSFAIRNKENAIEKMRYLLHKLIDLKWKEDSLCDKILNQFRQLLLVLERDYKVECEIFLAEKKRLDSFFYSVSDLIEKTALKDVWEVIQILLTLSHGQAAVERGFSVNSSLLQPNLKSHSLIAQRMIYDTMILSETPLPKFQVTPALLRSCSFARQKYSDYLQQQKDQQLDQEKKKKREREESELLSAKKRLKQLEHTAQTLTAEADQHALKAENKQNFTLLTKSNALRSKAKQMEKDIDKQKCIVQTLIESLKEV